MSDPRSARPSQRRFQRLVAILSLTFATALVSAPPLGAHHLDQPGAHNGAQSALDRINAFRAAAGVSPASAHPALMGSAAGHVAYFDQNRDDPALAGMGLHEERSDAPGFIGITIADRARAAGYRAGAVTENAGFGGLTAAIDWHMNTVNHRLPLIHPSALDMGMAGSEVSGFNVIQVGLRRDLADVMLPSVYPPDGATNVPTTWDGLEAPDPAPGSPRPLGYPITVAFGMGQRVTWLTVELRNAAGDRIEANTPHKDWMGAIAVIPFHPLNGSQTYSASIEASVDGRVATRTWSFTTAGSSSAS